MAATWWFLFRGPAPALRHAQYLRPDTAVRAVLCPARVQSYVSSLAPVATRFVHSIPQLSSMQGGPVRLDWLHKMPLEMALLFDQALPGRFGVTLFLQEHPAGAPLDELVNSSSFLDDFQPILWSSGLRREQGGKLLVDGQLSIPSTVQEQTTRLWTQYQPVEPPPLRGNHFLEISINNCNGALFQLQGALRNLFTPWADTQLQESVGAAAQKVLEAAACADLAGSDRLQFHAELSCADAASADALAVVFRTAVQSLSAYLQSVQGYRLEGEVKTNRTMIVADYQLRGFEPRLRHALGG